MKIIFAEILAGVSFVIFFVGSTGIFLTLAHWTLFRGVDLILSVAPFVAAFAERHPHAAALLACFALLLAGALLLAVSNKIFWTESRK